MGLQDEKVKPGKVMKAKRGHFSKSNISGHNRFMKSIGVFPKVSSGAGGKGSGTGGRDTRTITEKGQFIKRRKKLAGVKSALGMLKGPAKAGAILGAALTVPVGKMLKKIQDKRKAKNRDEAKVKKMGGGMMKKPGYKYGKMIEDKFNKYARSKETQLHSKDALEGFERAEKRSVSETMGEYKKDIKKYRDSKLKRLTRFSKGGGADTGTMGEAKSKLATGIDAFKRRLKKEKLQAPKRPPMNPAKVMGGGMMMKPMGYKSGTSVKVKCKLGRNKPTKMY